MKYTAEMAWGMTLMNRHSDNIKDYINEAIVQATREGKAWCTVMVSRQDYKSLVEELNEKDYSFKYEDGQLTISWFDGGASKL